MSEDEISEDTGTDLDLPDVEALSHRPLLWLWPRKGDQVFAPALEDWYYNARVNYLHNRVGLLGFYSDGYKQAADLLVKHAMEHRDALDLLIYPICSHYRHYLELIMKGLIAKGSRLLKGKYDYSNRHHDLRTLWKQCRELLQKLVDSVTREELDAVEETVVQIATVDPRGQAFRYIETKEGTSSIPNSIRHINVRNLMEVMERVGNFLEGADGCLFAAIEHDNEMREEEKFLI